MLYDDVDAALAFGHAATQQGQSQWAGIAEAKTATLKHSKDEIDVRRIDLAPNYAKRF